jgi:hypothetical protein
MTSFYTGDNNRLSLLRFSYSRQIPVSLTQSDWMAATAGGAALNVVAGFVNPGATNISRIPRVITAAGGATINITITGTYNGAAQTETFQCLTNATTDATEPFDTITSVTTDVDPVSNTTIRWGRSYCDPACAELYVTGTGNINCRLDNETALQVISSVPAGEWSRRVRIIDPTSTTATGLFALYP